MTIYDEHEFEISEVTRDELPSITRWFADNYHEGDESAADKHFADHYSGGGTTFLGRIETRSLVL